MKRKSFIFVLMGILFLFSACTVDNIDDLVPNDKALMTSISENNELFPVEFSQDSYKIFTQNNPYQDNRFIEDANTGILYKADLYNGNDNEFISEITNQFDVLVGLENRKISDEESIRILEIAEKFVFYVFDYKNSKLIENSETVAQAIKIQSENLRSIFSSQLYEVVDNNGYCRDITESLYEANGIFNIDCFFLASQNIIFVADDNSFYIPLKISFKCEPIEKDWLKYDQYEYGLNNLAGYLYSCPAEGRAGTIYPKLNSSSEILLHIDFNDTNKILGFYQIHTMGAIFINHYDVYVVEKFEETGIERTSDFVYFDYEQGKDSFLSNEQEDEILDLCTEFAYTMYDGIDYQTTELNHFSNLKKYFTDELNAYLEDKNYFNQYLNRLKKYEVQLSLYSLRNRDIYKLQKNGEKEVIRVSYNYMIKPFKSNFGNCSICGDALELFQWLEENEDFVSHADTQDFYLDIYLVEEGDSYKICNWSGTVRRNDDK